MSDQTRVDKRIWIIGYKAAHGCADCGEKDPRCLDLDHDDAATKDERLKWKINGKRRGMERLSWQDLKDEVAKCTVRCANCHRKRTAVQFGWKLHVPPGG